MLFAMRLTAAAFGCDFSPFAYLSFSDGPALLAWLLGSALVVIAVLIWLVLRHGEETLWLASTTGGALVPAAALEQPAAAAATGSHPDVVRAEVSLTGRGGALRARAHVLARPLSDVATVKEAVDPAVRARVLRLAGRDVDRVDIRVRVLTVSQLGRHLP